MMGCLFGVAASVLDLFRCIVDVEHVVFGEPHVDLEEEGGNERAVEIGIVCVDKVSFIFCLLEYALSKLVLVFKRVSGSLKAFPFYSPRKERGGFGLCLSPIQSIFRF